jgi:hypothetical protein
MSERKTVGSMTDRQRHELAATLTSANSIAPLTNNFAVEQ